MRTLVIECATEACSIALLDNGEVIAGEHRLMQRGHAEALVPMIAGLPDKGRAKRIAVSLGPGSFTGLRVGLATAKALGLAWQAEVFGYSTLELVAAMAMELREASAVTVTMTGGHGEWFIADFDDAGDCQLPCQSLTPQEACERAGHFVAGSQAQALVERRGFGVADTVLPDARKFPLIANRPPQAAELLYGRPPDAKISGRLTS